MNEISLKDFVTKDCMGDLMEKWDLFLELSNQLTEEFIESSEAGEVSKASWIAKLSCEFLGNYQGRTLGGVYIVEIEDFLEFTIPRKVTLKSKAEALDTINGMIAFWKFLKRAYKHPLADEVIDYLEQVSSDFQEWMFDRNKAGMSKDFLMSMNEAGVDSDDQSAVDEFMVEYNAQLTKQRWEDLQSNELSSSTLPRSSTRGVLNPFGGANSYMTDEERRKLKNKKKKAKSAKKKNRKKR